MDRALLSIENLTVGVYQQEKYAEIVKNMHLTLEEFKTLALVGASGSGKTTVGLSILGLLPEAMTVTGGKIKFQNEDLLSLPFERMRLLRGKDIAMVFQEPLNAFNPVFTIGFQMDEVLKLHTSLSRDQRREKVEELLRTVGIPDPKRVVIQYPHQLSGGMRQRAMIAMAISTHPKLIIADEPTSNLDVTLQAVILDLFKKLREEMKITFLLITHDFGVVKELADEVAVLYHGAVVEAGKAEHIFQSPAHPYTRELIQTVKD